MDRPALTGVAPEATRLLLARMRIVRLRILLGAFQLFNDASWIPVNSVQDFCLFAPPEPGPRSVIGNVEVGHRSSIMSRSRSHPLIYPGNRRLVVRQGLLRS